MDFKRERVTKRRRREGKERSGKKGSGERAILESIENK